MARFSTPRAAVRAAVRDVVYPITGVSGIDSDAAGYIAAAGITDALAKSRVDAIVRALRAEEVWDSLLDGFLLGDKFQASSATLKSLNLEREASGSASFNEWGGAFDGSSNGYTFSNAQQETSSSGFSWMALYQHDLVSGPHALLGSYQPSTQRGPFLTIGYTGATDDAKTALRLWTSTDGTAANSFVQRTDSEALGDWRYAFAEWDGVNRTTAIEDISPTTDTVASVWHNHPTIGLGMLSNTAYPFDGRILAAFVWDEAIGHSTYLALRTRLRKIFSSTIPLRPAVVFDGNSLTASAPGGGSNYPSKLLAKTGWDSGYLGSEVYAVSGDRLIDDGLPRLPSIISAWQPESGEDRLLLVWHAINDITAGTSSAAIIAAYDEYVRTAKSAGFRVVLCTLTPVASVGEGTTYAYSSAKQTVRAEVNAWITGTASGIVDQVIDLNEIATTYSEFADPTDATYYVSGDGLHHNDAGRALIADYLDQEVNEPIYTPF